MVSIVNFTLIPCSRSPLLSFEPITRRRVCHLAYRLNSMTKWRTGPACAFAGCDPESGRESLVSQRDLARLHCRSVPGRQTAAPWVSMPLLDCIFRAKCTRCATDCIFQALMTNVVVDLWGQLPLEQTPPVFLNSKLVMYSPELDVLFPRLPSLSSLFLDVFCSEICVLCIFNFFFIVHLKQSKPVSAQHSGKCLFFLVKMTKGPESNSLISVINYWMILRSTPVQLAECLFGNCKKVTILRQFRNQMFP